MLLFTVARYYVFRRRRELARRKARAALGAESKEGDTSAMQPAVIKAGEATTANGAGDGVNSLEHSHETKAGLAPRASGELVKSSKSTPILESKSSTSNSESKSLSKATSPLSTETIQEKPCAAASHQAAATNLADVLDGLDACPWLDQSPQCVLDAEILLSSMLADYQRRCVLDLFMVPCVKPCLHLCQLCSCFTFVAVVAVFQERWQARERK